MSKIDFDRPVEAYHGACFAMEVTDISGNNNYLWPRKGVANGKRIYMGLDGKCSRGSMGDMPGWRIRNVAEPKDDVPEWAVKRARELRDAETNTGGGTYVITAFAKYVAAHEDAPVDPDEAEAEAMAKHAEPDMVTPLPSARLLALQSHILAAIKRGRILERGEGK